MVFREIELGEIVIVGLDVGTFGDGETHISENRGQLVDDLRDRMDAADLERGFAHRQGDVDALGIEPRLERCVLEGFAALGERAVDAILQAINQWALALALVGRERTERLEQRGDRAALAERADAYRFERRLVAGGGDLAEDLLFELSDVGHVA